MNANKRAVPTENSRKMRIIEADQPGGMPVLAHGGAPVRPKGRKMVASALMLLLPVLGAYLGFQVGKWCFSTYSKGIFVRWQQIPNPPYKVTNILAASSNSLFIQTANGIYFNGDVIDCLKQKGYPCWRPVNEVDKTWLMFFPCTTLSSRFQVAAPPVSYVEYIMQNDCGGEYYNETYYLRSQDGELWVWQWGNFSMGMIAPFLFAICTGAMTGFLVGLLVAKRLVVLSMGAGVQAW